MATIMTQPAQEDLVKHKAEKPSILERLYRCKKKNVKWTHYFIREINRGQHIYIWENLSYSNYLSAGRH